MPLHEFEKEKYFQGCLPIEVTAQRGRDSLRFAAMKPVGLPDPRTGKETAAVIQLRKEDQEARRTTWWVFKTK